jgi:hypothetical protein
MRIFMRRRSQSDTVLHMSPSLARDLAQAGLLEGKPPRAANLPSIEDFESDLTILEWCALHRCSRAYFYKLRRMGLGPEVTYHGGTMPRITREADRRYRETAPTRSTRAPRSSKAKASTAT